MVFNLSLTYFTLELSKHLRKENSYVTIEDLLIIGAILPPFGNQNILPSRFIRHFNIVPIDSFDDNTKRAVFLSVIDWHFSKNGLTDNHSLKTVKFFSISNFKGLIFNHKILEFSRSNNKII
jgi:hypothetical protein